MAKINNLLRARLISDRIISRLARLVALRIRHLSTNRDARIFFTFLTSSSKSVIQRCSSHEVAKYFLALAVRSLLLIVRKSVLVYRVRIREVEHGVFTPFVLSTTGGMGREATTFYKRLADTITQKRQHPY